jgi:hypothetical protein
MRRLPLLGDAPKDAATEAVTEVFEAFCKANILSYQLIICDEVSCGGIEGCPGRIDYRNTKDSPGI